MRGAGKETHQQPVDTVKDGVSGEVLVISVKAGCKATHPLLMLQHGDEGAGRDRQQLCEWHMSGQWNMGSFPVFQIPSQVVVLLL